MNFSKAKRAVATLMLATMVLGQASTVSAGNGKNFKKFSMDTIPRSEDVQGMVSMQKSDNEQRWYLTLYTVGGLGTEKSNPNGNALAYSKCAKGQSYPKALFKGYKNNTQKQAYRPIRPGKGTICTLYLGSNSNNRKSYKLRLSGRFCS